MLGADHVAVIFLHKREDQSGIHVFLHELSLSGPHFGGHLRRELQFHLAGSPDRHDLGPHLPDIGSRFCLVVQNEDLGLAFLTRYRQEAAVSGPVTGKEADLIRRSGEDTLPRPVLRIPFIRSTVDLLLTAQEALDRLVALGVVGRKHLGQLDDPVPLELLIDLVAFQILQVVRKPLVLNCQKAEERRLAGSLIADHTDDIVELHSGPEHPRYRA